MQSCSHECEKSNYILLKDFKIAIAFIPMCLCFNVALSALTYWCISVNYTLRRESFIFTLYFKMVANPPNSVTLITLLRNCVFKKLNVWSYSQRCVCARGHHHPAYVQGPGVSHEVSVDWFLFKCFVALKHFFREKQKVLFLLQVHICGKKWLREMWRSDFWVWRADPKQ